MKTRTGRSGQGRLKGSTSSIVTAGNVLDFSDLMILGMAFPNILGVLMLSGKVRGMLNDYQSKLASGEIKKNA